MERKGFTLIELIIVIAVLGILISLILPRFADVRTDANTRVCVANLRGLAAAMAVYEAKEGMDVDWDNTSVDSLRVWEYIAAQPYCPYETTAPKAPYTLVEGLGPLPDRARCPHGPAPGDEEHLDHHWP